MKTDYNTWQPVALAAVAWIGIREKTRCSNGSTMKSMFFSSAMLSFALSVAQARDCAALAKLKLPETNVKVAEKVPAGSFTPPHG